MSFSFSFDDAREEISAARRSLQNETGLNWIGDRLLSSRAYAIDAWLVAEGYSATGSTWDRYALFNEKAPKALIDRLSELSAGWELLDNQLLGDPDNAVAILPVTQWKQLASEHLEAAEEMIALLEGGSLECNPTA